MLFTIKFVFHFPESSPDGERLTPSPVDPDCVEIDVNFNPDPADLVLSSVPGGELFNPRKHKFAEEELKPQPMIKKAKKVFVPDDQKVTVFILLLLRRLIIFQKYLKSCLLATKNIFNYATGVSHN